MAFKLGMTVDLRMAYILLLFSMTLTLMQGHSCSAEEKNVSVELSRQLCKAIVMLSSILFHMTLTLKTCMWLDHLVSFSAEHDQPKSCEVCRDTHRSQRHSCLCLWGPRRPGTIHAYHEGRTAPQGQRSQSAASACRIFSTKLPHRTNQVWKVQSLLC